MAKAVIDLFEVVQVDHHQGYGGLIPHGDSEFLRARVRVLTIIDMMLYSCSENGSSESRISCRAPILLPPISMGKKSPFEPLHFRGSSQNLYSPFSDLFLFRHFTAVL